MSFTINKDSIVKNETIIRNISNIINNDKVTNSYIIEGLKGSGKTLLASYFAKSLLCENFIDEPCCECTNCQNFDKNYIPDVQYISAKKSALSIDEARLHIVDNVHIKPQNQKYKIYIIEADEITIQAQNSLLKTIEDPPSYAVFIFMTSKINLFLPTILSRCTVFKTQYISSDLVYNFLKSSDLDYMDSDIRSVSNFETGSIGQAILLLSKNSLTQHRLELLNTLIELNKTDILGCINLAKQSEKYKADMNMFYNIILALYRDLFIIKTTNNKDLVNQTDIYSELLTASYDFDVSKIDKNFKFIYNAINTQNINNNFSIGMETLYIRLSNNVDT